LSTLGDASVVPNCYSFGRVLKFPARNSVRAESIFTPPAANRTARGTTKPNRAIDGPMSEKDEIVAVLRAAMPNLQQRWPIRSLALFGSVARGDASAASDIDLLVEFERPVGLSAFI